ncbi:preprotein translocase subunit SecG [Sinomicrobium pectinilyticum]|uniref:Protein-export membrane protein SecG n=1 Tax=Sinomicrobium pectinilyticum TaxID=1084421 RepID=A0A3N0E528_SINP1|nr:preprotein translocase subunit SecG [Sinomicrobium pectinilyticum]RNL82954.1 preprotein translocase subunit SecG [Sinomicrobium pectinilyticum]
MSTFSIFLVLIIIVSLLLILVIMVQNPKGGGLSSSFGGGGGQIVGGVKKTGDFLDKSTWTLATILIALILLSNLSLKSGNSSQDSKLLDGQRTERETTAPQQTDTPAPATDTTGTAQ